MRKNDTAPTTSTTLLRQIGGDVHHARWTEFVARYTPMCRQYMRRHFPSIEMDDILQETFAAIAGALPNYHYAPEEKGHFRNYLIGILRNKALMAVRKKTTAEKALSAYANDPTSQMADDVAVSSDAGWRKAIFEIALQQLIADATIHERTKQIFVRAVIKQEKPESIAQALGVSRNVVDQQKRRMLAKFKILVVALENVL